MPILLDTVILAIAATGAALVGGIFYAFSTFVMAALARLPIEQGAAAMQSINVTVLNPLFFAVFFGTGLIALIALCSASGPWGAYGTLLRATAAALYIVGTLGVTIFFNVPLSGQLPRTELTDTGLPALWAHYLDVWTWWNHVRTIAAIMAAALFAAAISMSPQ
jgi:uncharacterized membrane protein